MFDLFGPDMPLPLKFFIAFAVVLTLIGVTAWLVRRFGANRLGGAGRGGRQPRLAVIDAATVDARRRLVLIRRDNIEHLLMIGGPTDLVVEPNIVRAVGSREVTREPGRVEPAAPRSAPVTENSWPLQPMNEPVPVAPPRPYRVNVSEEPWHAPEPGARPRPADNSLTGLAAELSTRLNPDVTPAPVRNEPAPRVSAPPPLAAEAPSAPAQTDHNLAEMAQQLEAALRRAPTENRPPVTDPLAARSAPSVNPPPRPAEPRAPGRDYKLRIDPKLEPKFDINTDAKAEPRFDAKFEPRPEPKLDAPPSPAAKSAYDNLEEEMASLLGRPSGKS